MKLSGEELYSELVRWRARLHGRAANELHAFLTTNLLLLTKVIRIIFNIFSIYSSCGVEHSNPGKNEPDLLITYMSIIEHP